jgi:prolyl 4-hydroxylase
VNQSEILDFLSYCYYKIDDLDNAIRHSAMVLHLNPYNTRVKSNLAFYASEQMRLAEAANANETEDEEEVEKVPPKVDDDDDYMDRYRRLCRLILEENPHELDLVKLYEVPWNPATIPPSPLWRLISPYEQQCVYLSPDISPWESARRVAVEVLSISPPLIFFHNFLSPLEVEQTKASAIATGRLARSTVHDPATGKLIFADYRTSEGTFIYDKELYPNIIEIERRIALLSGLSLEKADDLQIAHYGPGGHYEPHVDMANQPNVILENEGGNRIATFLIYLNDVATGGATAFIEAKPGFVVRPRQGSALFWFNLAGPHGRLNLTETERGIAQPYLDTVAYNTGEFFKKDYYRKPTIHGDNGIWETRHAACPVHSGVKWVANKWIREYPQNSHRYHYR